MPLIASEKVCGICVLPQQRFTITTGEAPSFSEVTLQIWSWKYPEKLILKLCFVLYQSLIFFCKASEAVIGKMPETDLFAIVLVCSDYQFMASYASNLLIFSTNRSAAAWHWEKPVHRPDEPVQVLQSKDMFPIYLFSPL